jgi:hypothetical protein
MIKTAARRFNANRAQVWADRLLEHLETPDRDARMIPYREGASADAVIALKRSLTAYFCDGSPVTASDLLTVNALAKIDLSSLVPPKGFWPDPALADLIANLEPIWRRATGRSSDLISADSADSKKSPFAAWLGDLLKDIGKSRPPDGRVTDVVRALKREKSGTRHS